MLPDGRRLHMHDGPIDVIVEAFGAVSEIEMPSRRDAATISSRKPDKSTSIGTSEPSPRAKSR